MQSSGSEQLRSTHDFLQAQVGGGFNLYGYFLNFIVPLLCIGTRRFRPQLLRCRRSWFCTELITTAMQAGGFPVVRDLTACKTSPNMLYRCLSRLENTLPTTNPSKKISIDL